MNTNCDSVNISLNQNLRGGIVFYSSGKTNAKEIGSKDESWLFRKSPDLQNDSISMDSSSIDLSPPQSRNNSRRNTVFNSSNFFFKICICWIKVMCLKKLNF